MATKIYIDQGHNPVNPNAGAEGNGLREQDLVYRIGVEFAELLRQNGGFDVRLSRPTPDTQLGSSTSSSLAARVNEANAWGADYFISLHTNASENGSASGSEAFVYSRPSEAFELGEDLLEGLVAGKFGGVGLDVYEEEEGIFYEDRSADIVEDDILARLMTFPNVLITSHMGFFTKEAMEAIATQTLENAYSLENGLPLANKVV